MCALRRIVSNHARGCSPSNVSKLRQARSSVSCTRSSASAGWPVSDDATRSKTSISGSTRC